MSEHLRRMLISLVCAACVACAGTSYDDDLAAIEESPLGGEALVQRKHDLDRALRDMTHFSTTMSTLVDRVDSRSIGLLDEFFARYLEGHLDGMLRPQWQSANAELAAVDASLRFAKAELLIQLRYPRRVQAAINDIEKRYGTRGSMLVDYPVGEQGTLGEGLEILRQRKWKG
jgi:hypothetical protein